jgi:hypothetical protein
MTAEGGRMKSKDEGGRRKDEGEPEAIELTSSFIPHPSSLDAPPSYLPSSFELPLKI